MWVPEFSIVDCQEGGINLFPSEAPINQLVGIRSLKREASYWQHRSGHRSIFFYACVVGAPSQQTCTLVAEFNNSTSWRPFASPRCLPVACWMRGKRECENPTYGECCSSDFVNSRGHSIVLLMRTCCAGRGPLCVTPPHSG